MVAAPLKYERANGSIFPGIPSTSDTPSARTCPTIGQAAFGTGSDYATEASAQSETSSLTKVTCLDWYAV